MKKMIISFLVSCCLTACSGGGDSGSSSSGSTGGGGGGGGVTTSNTCYRSPSDTTYIFGCTTNIDGGVDGWIDDDFKCVEVTRSGASNVFKTKSAPNHKSYYYGSGSPNYDGVPAGISPNPNTISNKNYVVNIPHTPALSANPTATSMDVVGIAVNGVVFFNNQAAPGDSLAAELSTMDYGNGHPTSVGTYHYHIEPCYLTNNDGSLVGIMRDGFPVFGRKEPGGATPTYVDTCDFTNAETTPNCRPYPTKLPNFHCHDIAGFSGPKCHYHVITTDPFIIEYYAGSPGTFSNNP